MLAAATDRDNPLAVLQVALTSMSSAPQNELSAGLKAHVVEVLHEASVIARDPGHVGPTTSTEALELAVKLLSQETLLADLERIDTFNAISREVATSVLRVCGPLAIA